MLGKNSAHEISADIRVHNRHDTRPFIGRDRADPHCAVGPGGAKIRREAWLVLSGRLTALRFIGDLGAGRYGAFCIAPGELDSPYALCTALIHAMKIIANTRFVSKSMLFLLISVVIPSGVSNTADVVS